MPNEVTYPFTAEVMGNAGHLKFTLQGSYNRKLKNIDPVTHEIPLAIESMVDSTSTHYEYHAPVCKITDAAIQGGVNENYIIGISVEHIQERPALPFDIDPSQWEGIGVDILDFPDIILSGWPGGFLLMGGLSTDTDFTFDSREVVGNHVKGVGWHGDFDDQTDGNCITDLHSLMGPNCGVLNIVTGNYGNWSRDAETTWETELPVFDTDAHLLAFIRSGGEQTEGLLNGEQPVVVDKDKDYDYYLNDTFTLYSSYGLSYEKSEKHKYQFKIIMEKRGRVVGGLLALVNDKPYEPEDRYPRKYHLIGDAIRSVITWDGDQYVEYTGDDIKSLEFYRTTAGKAGFNYCQVQAWSTNIPFQDGANSEPWARQFLETGNPRGATNIKKIIPKETPITPGTPVTETPIPTPGFTISNGGRILGLTASQVNTFYSKIFNPADIQALLDGTQLFGSNQINSIKDLFYIPVSVEDIATCSTTQHIFLGSYDLDMGSSVKWVTNNNKLINCGTVDFDATFDSYLDMEPFCTLFIWLPFCGIHKLEVSKYINKTIHLRYAVSVFDGTCVAFLSTYANGHDVVLDSFQGNMSVHRPLQANDQQRQTTAIAQGILQTGGQVVGTLGSVAAGAGAIGSAASLGGIEAGVAAGVGQGVASGLPGANGAIRTGANTLQTAVDAPMSTRGALAGMLSMFDTMIPTFIVARLNSIEPENELEIVGKPSATGGKVGSFAGFLKTSAFDMPNFPGTIEEAQEIQNMFRGGVYVD